MIQPRVTRSTSRDLDEVTFVNTNNNHGKKTFKCPNKYCSKEYQFRQSLNTHVKVCPYSIAVVEKVKEPEIVQGTEFKTLVRTSSENVLSTLDDFVERTNIMESFERLKGAKKDEVRKIMGVSDKDNVELPELRKSLKRVHKKISELRNEEMFVEYGILYRENQLIIEENEIKRKTKNLEKINHLKDQFGINNDFMTDSDTDEKDEAPGLLAYLGFNSPFSSATKVKKTRV